MAFSYGFYNANNGDRVYNAVQISQLFDGLIRDGIYATIGTAMVVKKSEEGNKVIVGAGRAWFNHTWSYNDSDMLLAGPQSDLFLNRIDAIVLDIYSADAARKNDILWITGTAATNPVRPTMIKEPGHYQYPLAYVYRKVNTSIINQEDITNMVGSSDTPFVTGILQAMDIDNLLLQWRDQWAQFVLNYEQTAADWTDLQKTAFQNYVKEFEGEMNAWLKEMQDALGEAPATNLQNQIEELKIITGDGSLVSELGRNLTICVNNLYTKGLQNLKIINFSTVNTITGIDGIRDGFAAICRYIKDRDLVGNKVAFPVLLCSFYYGSGTVAWAQVYVAKGNSGYVFAEGLILSYDLYPVDLNAWPLTLRYNYTQNAIDVMRYPMRGNDQGITDFSVITQAQYNSITTKDPNALYIIIG